MMFAILFGLSMDYEVFLLSRIREEYDASGNNREAVAIGLAKTARVITSAALIMIAVFLSFVTSPNPTVKMIGLGLAVAVFVDATIVRLMLVPATMELLGNANWWLPKSLDAAAAPHQRRGQLHPEARAAARRAQPTPSPNPSPPPSDPSPILASLPAYTWLATPKRGWRVRWRGAGARWARRSRTRARRGGATRRRSVSPSGASPTSARSAS